jgi:hypothetical protein
VAPDHVLAPHAELLFRAFERLLVRGEEGAAALEPLFLEEYLEIRLVRGVLVLDARGSRVFENLVSIDCLRLRMIE